MPMQFIDIAFTCLIGLVILALDVITILFAVRARSYRMHGSCVLLAVLAVLLTYMLVEIIIEGGIHL